MRKAMGARLWLDEEKGPDGIWYIRDGKEKRSTGLSQGQREEANLKLAEYIAERYGAEAYTANASDISIPEVLALYIKSLERALARQNTPTRQKGIATRKFHVANLLTFWEDKSLADVRTSVCEKYEEHRKAMPHRRGMRKDAVSVSPATVRQELKTLSCAIAAWHGESPLPALPVVWTPPAGPARLRYLERSEVAKLLRAARKLGFGHLVRYILIGIYTGTRDDAMRRLRWVRASHDGYVDTNRGILYRAGFAETQTSKKRTPMILPDRLLSHLRRWQRIDAAADLSHVITYMKPLPTLRSTIRRAERLNTPARFPQPVGDIHKSWASMVKEAGLGSDVTPHTLKHTAITWMLWEGKTIWEVAEDTGTSAKTIDEVYGHHRTIESRVARHAKRRA